MANLINKRAISEQTTFSFGGDKTQLAARAEDLRAEGQTNYLDNNSANNHAIDGP